MESPNVSTEITIENPYWSEVRSLFANKKHISNKEYYQWIIKHAEAREKCCRSYAFAIADPASVAFVANHIGPRAIEIGAGTGYWAWQLSQHGVDIKAFDIAPPDRMPNFYFTPETQQRPMISLTSWKSSGKSSQNIKLCNGIAYTMKSQYTKGTTNDQDSSRVSTNHCVLCTRYHHNVHNGSYGSRSGH